MWLLYKKIEIVTGELLRTVKTTHPDKKPVFSRPVACNNDGSTVFVFGTQRGIVVSTGKGSNTRYSLHENSINHVVYASTSTIIWSSVDMALTILSRSRGISTLMKSLFASQTVSQVHSASASCPADPNFWSPWVTLRNFCTWRIYRLARDWTDLSKTLRVYCLWNVLHEYSWK